MTHITDILRHWPRLFSIRALIVILFLLVIFPTSWFPWFNQVDNLFFHVAGKLVTRHNNDKMAVLTLPPGARHETILDPGQITRIKKAKPAAIGLISDQHLGKLGPVLARNQVFVGRGVSRRRGEVHAGAIDFSAELTGEFVDRRLQNRLLALFHTPMAAFQYQQHAVPSYQSFPVTRDRNLVDYPMYWQQGSVQNHDFVNVLYKEWGGKDISTDLSGQARVIGMPTDSIPATIPEYSYKRVVADRDYSLLSNRLVLIGARNDPGLTNASLMLNGLISAKAVTVPAWAIILKVALAIIVLVYLLLLYRFRTQTAILLSAFLITLMLTAQVGMLVTRSTWLPLGSVVVLLLLGHVMMAAIRERLQEQVFCLQEHDTALRTLAGYQLENGEPEKAFVSLQQCETSDDSLGLLYRIGIDYERQRKYDRALQVYQHIASRRHAYEDVRSRIKSLQHADDSSGKMSAFNGARTLIMPSSGLEKPVLGRYELERELGRGAMGMVYLGKDPKIMRHVAIKTMDFRQFAPHEVADIKARFFREAEAAGKLNHPNIVTVFDVGEESDLAYIAMDYASGSPLSDWTRPDNLLPPETVYNIIAQVAQALDYAHRQGVVHRDIKPGNIIYDPEDERVRVTDFGIARITDTSATRTGTVMGSPSYMSPEQVTESSVDGRSDIFSLGVTLYQLLTGELPFKGDSLASVAYQITNKKHQSVREVRPELSAKVTRVVNKALQKKVDKRYAKADEMASALLKL